MKAFVVFDVSANTPAVIAQLKKMGFYTSWKSGDFFDLPANACWRNVPNEIPAESQVQFDAFVAKKQAENPKADIEELTVTFLLGTAVDMVKQAVILANKILPADDKEIKLLRCIATLPSPWAGMPREITPAKEIVWDAKNAFAFSKFTNDYLAKNPKATEEEILAEFSKTL